MKLSVLKCGALSGTLAVQLIGCGGSQPPIGAPGAMPQSRTSTGYASLYSFGKGSDGQEPKAALIDVNGALYGTTYGGGAYGAGTVFSVSTTGAEKVLYSFQSGNDGANPSASLLAVKGLLYGTTEYGGETKYTNDGTVFRISTSGTEKVLHRFQGFYGTGRYRYDGANPVASLIDVKSKLYGTTLNGGSDEYYGTVFEISTSGREKVLHSFTAFYDGINPAGSLLCVNGSFYGTTTAGPGTTGFNSGFGTVFSMSSSGGETVLFSFYEPPYGSDGAYPEAGLINVSGTLYGTTSYSGPYSGGAAFSITTAGYLTNLHNFGTGVDGSRPDALLLNVRGTLYGTTSAGGMYGKGTIFELTLGGKEKVLHSFGYGSDGATPLAALINVTGTLYGTTSAGGAKGEGTVFTLKL